MGKTKELNVDLRQTIINFHKSGNSYGNISKRLAISRSTVQSVIKKFKQFGTTKNLPGRGRPPKLLPRRRTVRKLCRSRSVNVVFKDLNLFTETLDSMTSVKMAATMFKLESSIKQDLPFIINQAKDWALTHGVLMRTADFPASSEVISYAPFALFPSVIPKSIYNEAKLIQKDFNFLMHKVAHDYDFLENSLKSVIAIDDFTKNLWNIYEAVFKDDTKKCQPLCLGLFRNDYMLHCPVNDSSTPENLNQVQLKQIEINTIASSFAGLAQNMVSLQRYTMSLLKIPFNEDQIPENKCIDGFSAGMVEAWNHYNKPGAVILFLISSEERNIFDQRWLEYGVFKCNPSIAVLRFTIQGIYDQGHLDENNNLIVAGHEIAIVYFRSGYSPTSYNSQQDWDTRKMIEYSNAIKCPSINYHLAGCKKIQQELSKVGVLEKYISDPKTVERLRKTFAKQYSLEMGSEGDQAIEEALKSVNSFVLKPQREGGGNNYFGQEMHQQLVKLKDSEERNSYILMQRLFPLPQRNVLIKPGKEFSFDDVVSELGIYGVIIGDADKVLYNEEVGHLVRTKTMETDEGGIAAGFAVMDSPFLI